MLNKSYDILYASGGDFRAMCREIIFAADNGRRVLRLSFFGDPAGEDDYFRHLEIIREEAGAHFKSVRPVVGYIAQRPFGHGLAAEVTYADGADRLVYGDGYITAESDGCRELFTDGITVPESANDLHEQSLRVFSIIGSIMSKERFAAEDICRQWNYISEITGMEGRRQRYQVFNDARSGFYSSSDWANGYPAATGIGSSFGGLTIELNAMAAKKNTVVNRPIDNKLQVSAHRYSQEVLVGEGKSEKDCKTTPKFERARLIGDGDAYSVYVSGTAAIRGEESLAGVGVVEQTRITMENIAFLLSEEATGMLGYVPEIQVLRVYVKYPEDFDAVYKYMESNHSDIPKLYLYADICRDELLVEIEGVAEFKKH